MEGLTEKAWEFFMALAESGGTLQLSEDAEHLLAMELSDAGYAKVIRTPIGSIKIEHSGLISTYSRRYASRVKLTPQGQSYLNGYVIGRMEGRVDSMEAIATALGSVGTEV